MPPGASDSWIIAGNLVMHRPKSTPAPPVGPEVLFVSSRQPAQGMPPPSEDRRRGDEATLRRIISNLGGGVLLVDPEGRLRGCTPARARLIRLRADLLVRRHQ